jgi:transient receptor potential cation channel subfamily A protein 1
MSVIRTFAVMLGDLDFLGTYVFPYYSVSEGVKNISYPLSVFCILGIFMILMSILLINLLIGLAVGDIKSVKKNAKLKRLTMQVLILFFLL